MTIFLSAGEASGDLHASELIRELRQRFASARFAGLGGDRMQSAGCQLYLHYRSMAFMGFAAVVAHLGDVRRNFRTAHRALLHERPDVVVLVDYPSFNLRLAAFVRKHLPQTKIYWYIPPKIWAWKPWRVHKIARLSDGIFGIFPFEPSFYQSYGYACHYVGNPTMSEMRSLGEQPEAMAVRQGEGIAILPGSRRSEVSHCLPRMLEAARLCSGQPITVAAAPGLDDAFYRPYLREGEQLTRDTYALLRQARVAVVNSGTATLEAALLGCPQVAVYHLACSRLLGLLRPWLGPVIFRLPFFTLVNIIPNREVICELLANDFTTPRLYDRLSQLLTDEPLRARMTRDYKDIAAILGTSSAPQSAASLIAAQLSNSSNDR